MHRDTFHACPRCACGLDADGDRLSCGQCHGMLIAEQELLDEIGMRQAEALLRPRTDHNGVQKFATFVYELPPPIVTKDPALPCPRCGVAMTRHVLFGVLVDRCRVHGVWLEDEAPRAILDAATAGL